MLRTAGLQRRLGLCLALLGLGCGSDGELGKEGGEAAAIVPGASAAVGGAQRDVEVEAPAHTRAELDAQGAVDTAPRGTIVERPKLARLDIGAARATDESTAKGKKSKRSKRRRRSRRSPRKLGVDWRWGLEGVELHTPSWSADGQHIALVRRDVGETVRRMLAEQAGLPQKAELSAHDEGGGTTSSRRDNPDIAIVKVGRGPVAFVDRGWSPAFVRAPEQLVYVRQVNTLTGYRVRNSDRQGNDIALINTASGVSRVLAEPDVGHLGQPFVTRDRRYVLFTVENAVEDGRSGAQGIDVVDLTTFERSTIVEAGTHTLTAMRAAGPRVLALELEEKQTRLIDLARGGQTLFEFPKTMALWEAPDFGVASDYEQGFLVRHKGAWQVFDDAGAPTKKEYSDIGLSGQRAVSPDGVHVAVADGPLLRVAQVTAKRRRIMRWRAPGKISDFAWSHDGRKVAVVASTYRDRWRNQYDRDLLFVLELQR